MASGELLKAWDGLLNPREDNPGPEITISGAKLHIPSKKMCIRGAGKLISAIGERFQLHGWPTRPSTARSTRHPLLRSGAKHSGGEQEEGTHQLEDALDGDADQA